MSENSTQATAHWLSIRVRVLCVVVLFGGALLPPYIPSSALAPEEAQTTTQQYMLVEEGFIMKPSTMSDGGRRAYAEGTFHTVREGENLERLAERYEISVDTIVWANDIERDQPLQVGQELLILPVNGVVHTVRRGQTLARISSLYDIDLAKIAEQNNIDGGFIMAGQELIIPDGSPIVDPPPTVVASNPTPSQPAPATTGDKPIREQDVRQVPSQPTYAPQELGATLFKPCSAACFITQYYHGGHFALDMQERGGGPIYAAEAGTVIRAETGWNGGYGNVIEVDHGNGLVTLYAHNKSFEVSEGDTVSRGQKIANMGNSGLVYGQTGIHVHFEVRVNGVKKNPLLYIE